MSDEMKIIMRNGRPFSFDPKTGRRKPIDIDVRNVQATGLDRETMLKNSAADDNNIARMGIEWNKENSSDV